MQVKLDLISLLSNKRGLSHRVRVEKTGRPPEHPTQTVVQRIVKAAEEEVSLFSDSGGSPHRNRTGGVLMIQHIPSVVIDRLLGHPSGSEKSGFRQPRPRLTKTIIMTVFVSPCQDGLTGRLG